MNFQGISLTLLDWTGAAPETHPGETGTADWRTFELEEIRVRIVEYSENYFADHWCSRGHVLQVLEGDLTIRLRDSREYRLGAGNGICLPEGAERAHLASSEGGARVLIID